MSKKNWISVKRGLSEDPKHREAMGEALWLYLHIIDAADWELGIVYDWRDLDIANDMSLSQRTVRDWRQRLQDAGYIKCEQRQHSLDIIIHNWTDPRSYSGKVLNKKQGDTDMSPSEIQGDTQGARPVRAKPAPSIESTSTSTSLSTKAKISKDSISSKEEEPKPVTPQVGRKKLALPPGSDLSWSVLDNTDDWKRAKIEGDKRAAPLVSVVEGLAKLNPNWPKHGENKEWDRVARLISIEVENENGTVDGFVKWVNRQKDRTQRIQWYGRKPGNVWEDWPLAFEPEPEEHHYPTVQELEAKGML